MEINCKYENNMILYTRCSEDVCVFLLSLPARWRGLKYRTAIQCICCYIAACAVAWIEISNVIDSAACIFIAACAVAWIEIVSSSHLK